MARLPVTLSEAEGHFCCFAQHDHDWVTYRAIRCCQPKLELTSNCYYFTDMVVVIVCLVFMKNVFVLPHCAVYCVMAGVC